MADYAISNVPRRVVYAPSGVGPYAFTFEILDQTDIAVYKASTLLTLTTDYTVTINTNGTGSVTLVATAGTSNITIVGAKNIQRTTDFTTGGDLFANTLNDELDNQTIFIQQVAETAERGLKAPVVDPTDINMTLPAKASRVGTVLAFNATTGNPEAGPSIASVTTVAAQSANINTVATNIASVNTVAGNITNVNTVAGVSGNVTTVASNIANVNAVGADLLEGTSEINTVAVDIANVNTVGNNIASVNTVAGEIGAGQDVTVVAANLSGTNTIGTVATNIANVNATGTNIANVNAVGADLLEAVSEINTVATDITNVNTVGTNIASVNTVAGISGAVSTVSGISANVTTVAGVSSNVTTVAGISSNVTTVAGISANVTSVAGNATNINAVAGNATNINAVNANKTNIDTVAGIAANVTTVANNSANVTIAATNVADINNFADVYQGAKATDPTLRNDGSALQSGDLYFNTTDDVMKVREAGAWLAAYASLSGALIAANNLSDVTSASTARTNLGLGTGNSPTFTTLNLSSNLTFTGTGNRITGDFSTGTFANRVAFQTSTTNSQTSLTVLPNGTNVNSSLGLYDNSDPTNAGRLLISQSTTSSAFTSGITGTGSYVPMTFVTGGSERLRIDTSGNVSQATGSYFLGNGGGFGWGDLSTYVGGTSATDFINFITNNSERMRIASNGDVGIGTSSPTVRLDIAGGTQRLRATGSSSDTFLTLQNDVGTQAILGIGSSASSSPSNTFYIETNAGKSLVVSSAGNVGIGTSSPNSQLNVSAASNARIELTATSGGTFRHYLRTAGDDLQIRASAGVMGFYTGNADGLSSTERMRIDSSGNLLVGTTATSGANTSGLALLNPTTATVIYLGHTTGTATGSAYSGFLYDGTLIGSITQSGTTAVAYNTTSDYRLKENVAPIQGALAKVQALKPCTYTWKSAPDEIGEGFLAHELAEVCPQAVTGEKDAVNKDGSIKPQSIDTSFLVATLTAAIQELKAIVDTQAARIAALESN